MGGGQGEIGKWKIFEKCQVGEANQSHIPKRNLCVTFDRLGREFRQCSPIHLEIGTWSSQCGSPWHRKAPDIRWYAPHLGQVIDHILCSVIFSPHFITDHGHLSLANARFSFSSSSTDASEAQDSTTGRVSALPSLFAGGASTFPGVKEDGSGCADVHPVPLTWSKGRKVVTS